jgi:hypothetical protein
MQIVEWKIQNGFIEHFAINNFHFAMSYAFWISLIA